MCLEVAVERKTGCGTHVAPRRFTILKVQGLRLVLGFNFKAWDLGFGVKFRIGVRAWASVLGLSVYGLGS